jgi:hypothetical protein
MAIKIVVEDTVGFKVKGTINNAAGTPQPFDFGLTCHRLDADQIKDKLQSDSEASIVDFLTSVVIGWNGVRDADNKEIPFSESGLRQLCKIAGVAGLSFRTYLTEVGAKEKN